MIEDLWQAVVAHTAVLAGVSIAVSAVLIVASVVGLPWFIARLPADYFCRALSERPAVRQLGCRKLGLLIAKNLLGGILAIVGIGMLVLPGQGIVTLLVALTLLDFPGKRRVERWLIGRPQLRSGLNWLRTRSGKPPFEWQQPE